MTGPIPRPGSPAAQLTLPFDTPAAAAGHRLEPADLSRLLNLPFSDEQVSAATAPPTAGLVEAAAGSGKTTVMAARVVWLVGTGAVRPGQVLGLTFTRKAAAELGHRIRAALDGARLEGAADWADEEPSVATYDAFAASLVADYGPWLGREEPARLLDDAARFTLAAETVAAAPGPLPRLSRFSPSAIARALLGLDAAMGANLVDDTAVRRQTTNLLLDLEAAAVNRVGRPYADVQRAAQAAAERLELLDLRLAYQARKRAEGLTEFTDQLADAIAVERAVPAVRADLVRRFAVVLLDEYQDTSSAQAILLRELFGPAEGDPGLPVSAVGDPFQAIYGWRGASASNLADFSRDFAAPGRPVGRFGLTVNRRSDRAVIEVACRLSERLQAATGGLAGGRPDGDAAAVGAASAARPGGEREKSGLVGGPAAVAEETAAAKAEGRRLRAAADAAAGQVVTAGFLTWEDEVAWIADRIAGSPGRGEPAPWREMAVLARRNKDLGQLWQALAERDVPVEIVGLGGLLQVPEVADLVACLRLIEEPAAGPDLVRLLTGPRWRFGRADLSRLGRRAAELASLEERPAETGDPVGRALRRALSDTGGPRLAAAIADPGPGFSPAAARRLRRCQSELAELARHRGIPVVDLLERVIAVTGLDLELASRPEPLGSACRRQVRAFREAVADYAGGNRTANLAGLLAWLDAERESGLGLGRAAASPDDSVKLLTVHRAKGLEWDVVYLPGLVANVFPSNRVTANPYRSAAALPHELRADAAALPRLDEVSGPGLGRFAEALRDDLALAEDRLAYVAATRARHVLVGTTCRWRAGAALPRQPSPYFAVMAEVANRGGGHLGGPPEPGPANPLDEAGFKPWPRPLAPAEQAAAEAAALVGRLRDPAAPERAAIEAAWASAPEEVWAVRRNWDEAGNRLLAAGAGAVAGLVEVPLPATLTASQLVWLQRAPAEFAASLARPRPRPPSRRGRVGRSFHEWIEEEVIRPTLVDDLAWGDEAEPVSGAGEARERAILERLRSRFRSGRFAGAIPVAVERAFVLPVAGLQIRGRIDAVYARDSAPDLMPAGCAFLIVDWKTGEREPDPLQLSVYRLAWARAAGVPPEQVAAGFYQVAEDRFDQVATLLDEAALERWASGLGLETGPAERSAVET
ncbi:MAG: ATP-dependent helicase [Propionibacteriaceae bacterium]|jgi:DNA helicase-2/ATP-dependent DNA helicase PcrA|nr:ATP-dependent helicase [Propionibacteriaceae bacterium]